MTALRRLFLPVSLVVLIWAALAVPLPLWGEAPGDTVVLDEHVRVASASAVNGDYLLTVVNVRPLTAVEVLRAMADQKEDVISEGRLFPQGLDRDAYFLQQRALFRFSADVAAAVALRAAGVPADPTAVAGEGALIIDLAPGSAVRGVLAPGDVIVAIDGAAIGTAEDLRDALQEGAGGSMTEVRFQRDGQEHSAVVTPGVRDGQRILGVLVETAARVPLPVDVTIPSGRIGGPSAGLLIALTVYDQMSAVDLARGRVIAGTGALEPSGEIRAVGGVRLKAIAAARSGADIFLAPAEQAAEARAGIPDGNAMVVIAVSTLDEAIAALDEP